MGTIELIRWLNSKVSGVLRIAKAQELFHSETTVCLMRQTRKAVRQCRTWRESLTVDLATTRLAREEQ